MPIQDIDPTITQDPPEQSADQSTANGGFPAEGSSSPEAEQGNESVIGGIAEGAAATEEDDADYLPTEQEKVFPPEVYARYAKRYGYTPEEASDPRIQRLLGEKINSDIWIRQQQAQAEAVDEQVDQPETAAEPIAPMSQDEYFQKLDQFADAITSPEIAAKAFKDFMGIWEIKDPKQQEVAFGRYFGKYTTNLVNTILPTLLTMPNRSGGSLLDEYIQQKFPELGSLHDREQYSGAWNRVRTSDPAFAKLPAYGTAEFKSKMTEAAKALTGDAEAFQTMTFKDKRGNPLPPAENNAMKYTMLAKFATGQQVNPAVVQQAVQTGKTIARRAAVQRDAGKLGSGQTKGQFQAGGGKDLLRQEIEAQRAQANPFADAK